MITFYCKVSDTMRSISSFPKHCIPIPSGDEGARRESVAVVLFSYISFSCTLTTIVVTKHITLNRTQTDDT